eukprot:747228-Amphidinium_carterae.1
MTLAAGMLEGKQQHAVITCIVCAGRKLALHGGCRHIHMLSNRKPTLAVKVGSWLRSWDCRTSASKVYQLESVHSFRLNSPLTKLRTQELSEERQ